MKLKGVIIFAIFVAFFTIGSLIVMYNKGANPRSYPVPAREYLLPKNSTRVEKPESIPMETSIKKASTKLNSKASTKLNLKASTKLNSFELNPGCITKSLH